MISREDKKDVARSFGQKAAKAVSNATNDARNKAIHAKMGSKSRGNYSIFRSEGGKETRLKHGLSHGEMHHELKTNPAYRGTDKYGFSGGRTYKRK